jgi:mono/diheme cytochrome c family protein
MFGIARRGAAFAAIAASAAAMLAGCGGDVKGGHADTVAGKQLFVQKCGACHTLARAATKGTVGPNLDAAFSESVAEGFRRSAIEGVVHEQVLYPARSGQMPAKLVTGQKAADVAAYVAYAAARPGQDQGNLASAVKSATQKTATAANGRLAIDVVPSGQLAYQVSKATATAGALEIDSKNPTSTPHDIAIQQGTNGPVLGQGSTVTNGGVSKVSVNLKPGTYTFYCTLPGHRAGGMVGTITVK